MGAAATGVSLAQYEVADNVELVQTLQEWEDYYELRFARKPKLVKKLSQYSEGVNGPGGSSAAKGVSFTPRPRLRHAGGILARLLCLRYCGGRRARRDLRRSRLRNLFLVDLHWLRLGAVSLLRA